MARGKKNKQKLAFGGVPLDQTDASVDSSMNQVAGNFGPWGALAQFGSSASKAVLGDGTDSTRNIASYTIDPYKHIKALASGRFKEAVPILGELAFNKRMKGQAAAAKNQLTADRTLSMMQNMASFAKGGKINSLEMAGSGAILKKKLVSGGTLEQISPDAVEVIADNPSETDSVELTDAFVDNNEVIDRENRVFSDDLQGPSGKSIAKEAKKLEKMKNTNARFGPFNEMIESRLDNLFVYQEDMKKKLQLQESKRKAGRSYSDILYDAIKGEDNTHQVRRLLKPGYALGGFTDPKRGGPRYDGNPLFGSNEGGGLLNESALYNSGMGQQVDLIDGTNPNTRWEFPLNSTEAKQKNRFDWNKAGTAAATFGSNVLNQYLISKLHGPSRPQGERLVSLDRMSPNALLAEIGGGFRNAQTVIGRNVAQSSNLVSATGSLLAKRLAASNSAIDSTNRLNSQIASNEAQINVGINARNIGRLNQYRDNITQFKNKKLQLTSQNAANTSEKIMMRSREKNQMDKDLLQMAILQKAYGDSGVYDRAIKGMLDEYLEKKGMVRKPKKD